MPVEFPPIESAREFERGKLYALKLSRGITEENLRYIEAQLEPYCDRFGCEFLILPKNIEILEPAGLDDRAINALAERHSQKRLPWPKMAWSGCATPGLQIEGFEGQDCYVGVSLSHAGFSSKIRLFLRRIKGVVHYYGFGVHYLNEVAAEQARQGRYAGSTWLNDGHLAVTPGNRTDVNSIAAGIIEDTKEFRVRALLHDPWQSGLLLQALEAQSDWNESATPMPIAVGATIQNFSPPMKELAAAVLEGRFHHDGDPVLGWMISNVVAHWDTKGNVYPRKARREEAIDGVVAVLMALGRALAGRDA